MGLSCSCGEWDGDGWAWTSSGDFTTLNTSRRKRCCSCKKLIDIGATVVTFERVRHPITEVEMQIYGDGAEINLAPWYMCEICGEIYLNLDALGFCVDIEYDSMQELLKEYQQNYLIDNGLFKGEISK
jgi:hypothetical protein